MRNWGFPPRAMAISRTLRSPWERAALVASRMSMRPTFSRILSVSPTASPADGAKRFHVLFCCERTETWTFSKTVSRGKTFTTWKDRDMPLRQTL